MAKRNARNSNTSESINFSRSDMSDVNPFDEPGIIIMNPPYGERLRQENLNDLYKNIGDKLKKDFNGSEAWIFSGNPEALKHVGLHPARKLTLFNGQLECKFQKYVLYEGSKKRQTQTGLV